MGRMCLVGPRNCAAIRGMFTFATRAGRLQRLPRPPANEDVLMSGLEGGLC
jgi:hypothetical protein